MPAEPAEADAKAASDQAPRRNTNRHFVGIDGLKTRHAQQLKDFEKWAKDGKWEKFEHSHYDWWLVPINLSSSQGLTYTVYEDDIAELKSDREFMTRYRRGIELLALSWGWDIHNARPVRDPARGQHWIQWDVRLKKTGQSLMLFGQMDYHRSLEMMFNHLAKRGTRFDTASCPRRGLWPFALLP